MAEFNKLFTQIGISSTFGQLDGQQQRYILEQAGISVAKEKLFNIDLVDFNNSDARRELKRSLLGTPVISNLEIKGGSYKTLDGDDITFQGIRIDTVLFNITQQKNIVTTPIVGLNGTIKEYVSDGDFMISAECVIIGETIQGAFQSEAFGQQESDPILRKIEIGNSYPERDVITLIKILKAPIQLEIRSSFLDRFEINTVVVDSYDFIQTRGTSNLQVVQLRLLSDPNEQLSTERSELDGVINGTDPSNIGDNTFSPVN